MKKIKSVHARNEAERKRLYKTVFGDLPLVDAPHDLYLPLFQQDADGAIRKDGANCVLARACGRVFGSTAVIFTKEYAYIDLFDGDGHHVVYRAVQGAVAKRIVAAFDRGTKEFPAQTVRLLQPKSGRSLEGRREYTKNLRAKKKEVNGKKKTGQGKGANTTKPRKIDLSVRDYSGHVHHKVAS